MQPKTKERMGFEEGLQDGQASLVQRSYDECRAGLRNGML